MCPVTSDTVIEGIQLSFCVASPLSVTAGPLLMLRGVSQVLPLSVERVKNISERAVAGEGGVA